MRVPSPTTGTTRIPNQSMDYLRPATPDLSGLTRGLSALAGGLADAEAKKKSEADQLARFKATEGFVEFNANAQARINEMKQSALPEDLNFADRAVNSYQNYEDEFIATLPPDIQDEFRMRTASTRTAVTEDVTNFQRKNLQLYQKNSMGKMQDKAGEEIVENPDSVEGWKAMMDEAIDNSSYSDVEKHYMKQENARLLESRAYKETVKREKLSNVQYSSDLVGSAQWAAAELGTTAVDLLTVISYETGGKFSTSIKGGAGGRHIGLIQFGKEEAKKYGVHAGQTPAEQMKSVVAYLKDRGFKPGMNILDLYSTINAGSPGRYNASDANNGGAPGTVADKVRTQMSGHRAKAIALLGGKADIPDTIDEDPRFSNVPYEDRMSLRKDADTEVNSIFVETNRVRKAEHDARVNDLLVRVQAGQAGRTEYDQMVDEGLLPDYDERKKILGAIEDREKEGKLLREAQKHLAKGAPFDPTDAEQKKWLNALVGEEGLNKLQARDTNYVSDELIPLFTKTGVLPGDVVGQLRGQAQSSNPANMLYAFQALSLLENTNPTAYGAQVPDSLKHRADLWETLRGSVPEKDLVDMLREAPTQAQRDQKEYWLKEGEKLFTTPTDPVKFANQFSDFGAAPTAPAMRLAETEWNTLFLENFSKTLGNKDAAVALTNKQFTRNWGKSTVNGEDTLMKHPPELYTPTQAGTHEWLRNQVRGELGLTENEQSVLFTDERTMAEVEKAKNGVEVNGKPVVPTWLIMVQRESGEWTFARNEKGEVLRHEFKPTPYDAKAHELDLRVQSKQMELNQLAIQFGSTDNVGMPPPKELLNKEIKLRAELEALTETKEKAVEDAQHFYESPAAKEVIRLQKEYNEFQRILYEEYLGPLEEFPRAAEFEKVIDDLEKAKAKAEIELSSKRKSVTGEGPVQIFTPPEDGVEKNWLTDALGITEEEAEVTVPDYFKPVGQFAVVRQTDDPEVINNLWDSVVLSGAPPSKMRNVVDKLLQGIPATRIPEKDKNKFAETLTIGAKSPLARLGMVDLDPSRVVMFKTRAATNLGGTYTPTGDWLFFASNSPESFIHETMHRGMKKILPKLNKEERELLTKRYSKNLSGEEAIVRMLTRDLYPERERPRLSRQMDESASFFTSRSSDLAPLFKRIKELAEEEVK